MEKTILILAPHVLDRSPSQRYRFEQYLDFLNEKNISYDISHLLDLKDGYLLYGEGRHLRKILIVIKSLRKRLSDILRSKHYDFIYIHKSAFFFGLFIEKWIRIRSKKVVYDFDDAIWVMHTNHNQGIFNRLKNPDKTSEIIALSDHVIAGNTYLAEYARKYNSNVSIIPSTINLDKYNVSKKSNSRICIGWTGSFSTIRYFNTIVPVLEKIKQKYGDTVYFKLIGEPSYRNKQLGITGIEWNSETEARDLSELDIGIMPLPATPWTRGKCAMKGIQYMALGIATVLSPVGMNKDVISDGENGFLAATEEEWLQKLSILIEDNELRKKLGEAGKETVKKKYSVQVNKERWLNVFN